MCVWVAVSMAARQRKGANSRTGAGTDGAGDEKKVVQTRNAVQETATSAEEVAVAEAAAAEIELMQEKMKVPATPESDQLLRVVVVVQYMLPMVLIMLWAMWKGKLSIVSKSVGSST